MINDAENKITVKGLAEKYSYNYPVPDDIQDLMMSRMGPVYKKVLKKVGHYSILSGIALTLYFFIKKTGIAAFVFKTIVATVVISSITFGGYKTYKYIIRPATITQNITVKKNEAVLPISTVPERSAVQYVMVINPSISGTLDKETVQKAARLISEEISKIKGSRFASVMTGTSVKTKYSMNLSMERMDEVIVMHVKIIDRQSSEIRYSENESIDSIDRLDTACRKTASAIVKSLDQ